MRGRRLKKKIKAPRLPRRKVVVEGKPHVMVEGRVGVIVEAGPEQSVVHFVDDRHLTEYVVREGIYPNTWLKPERVRVSEKRVLIRERIKSKRVRIK